jgi:hypothetical protein
VLLARIDMTGAPVRAMADEPGATIAASLVGVDVTRRAVDGVEHTVVQVLLDDDRPDFPTALYDAPIVADLVRGDGSVVARELLDHDRFRRQLAAEREEGRSERRGVLLLDGGQLPEPWVRLAFLPVPLAGTAGTTMQLRRTTVDELLEGIEGAVDEGAMTAAERASALTAVEHLHPRAD